MNLTNNYYYFKSALSPILCDEIIKYGKQHNSQMAVTGGVEAENARKKDGKLKK